MTAEANEQVCGHLLEGGGADVVHSTHLAYLTEGWLVEGEGWDSGLLQREGELGLRGSLKRDVCTMCVCVCVQMYVCAR